MKFQKKIFCILLTLIVSTSSCGFLFAHSGRTDSSGGHHDYNNASGLGSYHYHHGNGPHLHPDGVCPYSSSAAASTKTAAAKSTASNSKETNKAAQQKLKDLGYYSGEVDGSFGKLSKSALKAFQKDNGLTVDGSLGPKSKAALGIE